MVSKWTSFWLTYRRILIQDIIHIRRPDMQAIDSVMHVTPNRTETVCALAMFYNPSLFEQTARFQLPLYYTGEAEAVRLEWGNMTGNGSTMAATAQQQLQVVSLARDYSVSINVTLGPREINYLVIHRGHSDGKDLRT